MTLKVTTQHGVTTFDSDLPTPGDYAALTRLVDGHSITLYKEIPGVWTLRVYHHSGCTTRHYRTELGNFCVSKHEAVLSALRFYGGAHCTQFDVEEISS